MAETKKTEHKKVKDYKGRCMRCRENDRPMKNVEITQMKNGMYAAKGNCKKCDCKMYKIIGKTKPE